MNDTTIAIDINKTSLEELCLVPGFGSALAERVIAHRPFSSVEDMMRVPGIGDRLLDRIRPYICVTPPVGIEIGPAEVAARRAEVEVDEETPAHDAAEPEAAIDILLAPVPEENVETEAAAPALPDSYAEPLPPPLDQLEPPTAAAISGMVEAVSVPPVEVNISAPVVEPEAVLPVESAIEPVVRKEAPSIESRPSRLEVFAYVLLGGFLALVLGILATLGILRALNGDIFYASASRVNSVQAQVGTLGGEISALQQENAAMRLRLDALEALGGRVSAVEREAQSLRTDLAAADRQILALQAETEALAAQTEQLAIQTAELQQRTRVFQNFLDGLRDLLIGLPAGEVK
jgi:hypothetical protein